MPRFNLNELLSMADSSQDGCIYWSRAKSKGGYGQIWDGTKVQYVHRLVAQIAHGQPEPGQEVLHSCDNRACINPVHLRWGTRKENMQDAIARNRLTNRKTARGIANGSATLTYEEICELRKLRNDGWKLKDLSAKYGITMSAISSIAKMKVRKYA